MIFINPGSGPVLDATEANARANIAAFVADLSELYAARVTDGESANRDGRWAFSIEIADGLHIRRAEIDMPGLPLEQVRYLGQGDQNIWDFPRLYVDGDSWVWEFALSACDPKAGDE